MVTPLSSSSHLASSNEYHSVPRRAGETGNSDRRIRKLHPILFLSRNDNGQTLIQPPGLVPPSSARAR